MYLLFLVLDNLEFEVENEVPTLWRCHLQSPSTPHCEQSLCLKLYNVKT